MGVFWFFVYVSSFRRRGFGESSALRENPLRVTFFSLSFFFRGEQIFILGRRKMNKKVIINSLHEGIKKKSHLARKTKKKIQTILTYFSLLIYVEEEIK